MKLKYKFIINEIAGQFVAVPIGDGLSSFNGMIKLNDTGAYIFDLLKDDISMEDLILKTASNYGCSDEEAKENVCILIDGLKKAEILEF